MATDWTTRAREIAADLLGICDCDWPTDPTCPHCGSTVDDWGKRIAALAAEAEQTGEAKHGEHHQCQRCYDAGHAAGVREEREACMAALCIRCSHNAPIQPRTECALMGHTPGPCHTFQRDDLGRATTHIGCAAAALRAREG